MSTIVSNRQLGRTDYFHWRPLLKYTPGNGVKEYFPGLIVPPHSTSIGALGVALQALESGSNPKRDLQKQIVLDSGKHAQLPFGSKLVLNKTLFPESNEIQRRPFRTKTRAYLGIDIGSTTTKYALIDDSREIMHKCYVPTQGKPVETTQKLLNFLKQEVAKIYRNFSCFDHRVRQKRGR